MNSYAAAILAILGLRLFVMLGEIVYYLFPELSDGKLPNQDGAITQNSLRYRRLPSVG